MEGENKNLLQFLYHVIGPKQKTQFASNHITANIRYDGKTIQVLFLHMVCQSLGLKYIEIQSEFKQLVAAGYITDDMLHRQLAKVTTEEERHHQFIHLCS